MTGDVHVVRLRKSLVCAHCSAEIHAGELAHLLDRDKRETAHVSCDLKARDLLRWSQSS